MRARITRRTLLHQAGLAGTGIAAVLCRAGESGGTYVPIGVCLPLDAVAGDMVYATVTLGGPVQSPEGVKVDLAFTPLTSVADPIPFQQTVPYNEQSVTFPFTTTTAASGSLSLDARVTALAYESSGSMTIYPPAFHKDEHRLVGNVAYIAGPGDIHRPAQSGRWEVPFTVVRKKTGNAAFSVRVELWRRPDDGGHYQAAEKTRVTVAAGEPYKTGTLTAKPDRDNKVYLRVWEDVDGGVYTAKSARFFIGVDV